MSIPVLVQVYDEMRRLAIAGSAVAPGDFRLKKLIAPLEKSAEKAPVFAKVAQAVQAVVDSNDKTASTALLELTTLVNAILHALARIALYDRVITIEDTMELQCPVQNYVDLRAVGSVTMLDCLRASMRLKPTRIVVGEVRGAEAHVMLKAWNTGHPGGAATVHANDAVSGLMRLESLVAEATAAPQQSLIAEAIDLVIFIDEESDLAAGRKVRELLVVTGYDSGRYAVEYV